MNDDEAKAMLAILSDHYGEPVMTLKRYCAALETWRRAVQERAQRMTLAAYPGIDKPWGTPEKTAALALFDADAKTFTAPVTDTGVQRLPDVHSAVKWAREVSSTFLSIRKSNLLARLIYDGQELRTTP